MIMASRQELIDQILLLQGKAHTQSSRIEELEFELDWMKRQLFGTKAERFIPDDELQMALDLGVVSAPPTEQLKKKITYERKPPREKGVQGHGRGQMPTHLPIIEKIIEPDEDVSEMVRIGEEVSWYYDMEPASLHVVRTVRPKYARPEHDGVVTADLPALPIEKGNAGPGLITRVLVDKFVYHLPLFRQRKRFKSEYDVHFSDSWLNDIVKGGIFLLEPLHREYVGLLLKADYLCADETPIPVLCKDKRGKTHRGYFWVYYDPLQKIVIFDYRKSRSRAGPSDFLRDYQGSILQVDGYDGYNEIISRKALTRAACMDHVRRKFDRAKGNDCSRAVYALSVMREWYKVESDAKAEGISLEERFERRTAHTVPSMREFHKWLNDQLPLVFPKSGIGMAIQYALNQWPYFEAFMTDPRVEISNIATENAIRPVALGRKNYMFMGSHEAAQRAAIVYSLVGTAKAHGVDPFGHIKELLTKLPSAMMSEIPNLMLPQCQPPAE